MNTLWKVLSLAGLALTVVPAFLVLMGEITWGVHAVVMMVGTVLYFVTAPLWMNEKRVS